MGCRLMHQSVNKANQIFKIYSVVFSCLTTVSRHFCLGLWKRTSYRVLASWEFTDCLWSLCKLEPLCRHHPPLPFLWRLVHAAGEKAPGAFFENKSFKSPQLWVHSHRLKQTHLPLLNLATIGSGYPPLLPHILSSDLSSFLAVAAETCCEQV